MKMTSWKKKIKLRFGRHSGDVSPPATLIDDLPPPFARSMSLRHPGYTREGDLRPDSFLLLDDQRIPTLRRTWSFRQAVSKHQAPPSPRFSKPVYHNGTTYSSTPECPPSPTKPAFFSRLFRFSLRDKHKSKNCLPPSVAHVDVIRTGDPDSVPSCHCVNTENGGGGGGNVFNDLSQWPSVQSDIVNLNTQDANGFIPQWASVPTDMTSSVATKNALPPSSAEWSSAENCLDDEEDPDVVVIRRCTTLPVFRMRSKSDASYSELLPSRFLEQDSIDSNTSLPVIMKHAMNGGSQSNIPKPSGVKKKNRRNRQSKEVQQDELKFLLLNGTYPPKCEEKVQRPNSFVMAMANSATLPLPVNLDSPCSDDSAVGDLSPVNPSAVTEARNKFAVDSGIFDGLHRAADRRTSKLPTVLTASGPTIDLEDPKTTRRRFESRLPSSCRPASVSPVRDPAVIRRVKKNTAPRPVSYTPGFALMQRTPNDLHFSRPLPITAERPSSAEPLARGHSVGSLTHSIREEMDATRQECVSRQFGSMQDVRGSRPSTPLSRPSSRSGIPTRSESREHLVSMREAAEDEGRVSRQSDEVDTGTFVRRKPVPLQRSGTFTKEDSTTPVEELPVVETQQEEEKVKEEIVRCAPARRSIQRRELRKPGEVAKVKESSFILKEAAVKEPTPPPAVDRKKSLPKPKLITPPALKAELHSQPKEIPKLAFKLQPPGSFVRNAPQNSSRRRIPLAVQRQTSTDSSSSNGAISPCNETAEDRKVKEEVTAPTTPRISRQSRLAAPGKIAKAKLNKQNSGLKLVRSPESVAPCSIDRNVGCEVVKNMLNKTFDVEESEVHLSDTVSKTVQGVTDQIRSVISTQSLKKHVSNGLDAKNASKATQDSPTTVTVESDTKSPTKSEFDHEILRLGAQVERRSLELSSLRDELKRTTVAFAAMALAAQYWNERLARTDEYSERLRKQLLLSEETVQKAHGEIESFKKNLQHEISAHEKGVEQLAELHSQKITQLEESHRSTVAALKGSYEDKVDQLKHQLEQVTSHQGELVDKEILEQLKVDHERALRTQREEVQCERESAVRIFMERQRELEKRLEDKSSQYNKLNEEANGLQAKVLQSTDSKIAWLKEKNDSLQKEVSSLNAVLEMKSAEVRELLQEQRENQERKEKIREYQELMDKQKARIEDLTAQIGRKSEVQDKLVQENVRLLELSEKRERIISQMDRDNETLRFKLNDAQQQSSSFTVDHASTPIHRPLREAKSVGAPVGSPEDSVMSQSWHISFDGAAVRRKRTMSKGSRKSSSSESKNSDDEVRHNLDEVFSREEQAVLAENAIQDSMRVFPVTSP